MAEQAPTLEDGLALVDKLQLEGWSTRDAVKEAAAEPAGSPGKCSMTVCLPAKKESVIL